MAVVSTFVYLTTFSEGAKRTIHTVVALLTALMAETGPTRYSHTYNESGKTDSTVHGLY